MQMASYYCHVFTSFNRKLALLSIPNSHSQTVWSPGVTFERSSQHCIHWLQLKILWNNMMYSSSQLYILKVILRLLKVIFSIGILLSYSMLHVGICLYLLWNISRLTVLWSLLETKVLGSWTAFFTEMEWTWNYSMRRVLVQPRSIASPFLDVQGTR